MNRNSINVLLVEDNSDHVELILEALENNGIASRIDVVGDGEGALDYLFQQNTFTEASRPALIILDIKLPKIDGIEVLRKIKTDESLKMIPVIMLTTSNNEEDVQQSYKLGANSYIVKPVTEAKFSDTIRQLKHYWMDSNKLPG
jgi:two-component system, response regulator